MKETKEKETKEKTEVPQLSPEEKAELILEFNTYAVENYPDIKLLYPCFIGRAGSGKSSRALHLAKKLNKSLRILILSQLLPEDVGGIPFVDRGQGITYYTLPEWINYELIFFDEIDKARESKLAVILSILSERRLHGKEIEGQFIFGAQESINGSSFLDRLLEAEEIYEALARRLIIIPCYIEDAFRYVSEKFKIKINIPEDEITKKMKSFKMSLKFPPILEYIILFSKWVLQKKLQENNEQEAIEKTKVILTEIFYYIDGIEQITEQIFAPETFEEEMIAYYKRALKNPKQAPLAVLSKALTCIPHMVSGEEFWKAFAYLYYKFSIDERKKLFEELYNKLSETLELTTDDEITNARWFVASWAVLGKKLQPSKEIEWIYEKVNEYLPEEISKIEEVLGNE